MLAPAGSARVGTTRGRSAPAAPARPASGPVWRLVLGVLLAVALVGCSEPGAPAQQSPPEKREIPVTGPAAPGMASFDSVVTRLMRRWGIPGGAVAVVRDGRLVLARGYGYADVEAEEPVAPDALFRLASISKPITAVAVLRLVQEGRLTLDARAFDILSDLEPPDGATVDPRIREITVRQLLRHTGGWDRDESFDPMFRPLEAAEAVGAPAPADAETVIRYMLGRPLDFDPGTRYAYSNLGYAVLGRVIERVTGSGYEDHVRAEVLAPVGAGRMRIGRTREAGRLPGEVKYYGVPGDPASHRFVPSIFPDGGEAPVVYGGFHLEAMDAHGGWVGSAVDLLRFATAVDGLDSRPDMLAPATIGLMTRRPAPPPWEGSPYYYALGWMVRPAGDDANWWHTGSLPGTATILVRTHHGMAWAALFNARASDAAASFSGDLDAGLWEAVDGVTSWPSHDLFERFD